MGKQQGGVSAGKDRPPGWGGRFLQFLLALALIGLAIFGMQQCRTNSRGALETEIKQNLYHIQLALERYSVDHDGLYPAYLIGGEFPVSVLDPAVLSAPHELPLADPLVRAGYLPHYPANPFQKKPREAAKVLQMQAKVPTSITGDDPLRPGTPAGDALGYRFGASGALMGQVLCDPRYESWQLAQADGTLAQYDTWAIIEYRFWDMWLEPQGDEPYLMFSPGQFFYKSYEYGMADNSPLAVLERMRTSPPANRHQSLTGEDVRPVVPVASEGYILGAYGSLRTKGYDCLGEETLLKQVDYAGNEAWIDWLWTRSTYSQSRREGSPFGITESYGDQVQTWNNANGIPDSIIILLQSGCG
ncbi:hypothetical protein JW859_08000 [bacterium]|nr:hypothetical protein [bacterium]